MTTGTVSTKPLTDIANAIRQQNGTSASYKSREMAALDGTKADTAGVEDHKGRERRTLLQGVRRHRRRHPGAERGRDQVRARRHGRYHSGTPVGRGPQGARPAARERDAGVQLPRGMPLRHRRQGLAVVRRGRERPRVRGRASLEGRPHRGEDGLPALLAQGCGHHEHRVLVQRLLESPVGERVREPERCGGCDPAVRLVQRASHRERDVVRQLQDQEVRGCSLRVQ